MICAGCDYKHVGRYVEMCWLELCVYVESWRMSQVSLCLVGDGFAMCRLKGTAAVLF